MANLELDEYGPARRWNGSPEGLEYLLAEAERWKVVLGLERNPIVAQHTRRGSYIRAEGVTGFIGGPEGSLEIRPKFLIGTSRADGNWRVALWKVLELVHEAPPLGFPVSADIGDQQPLLDLLGWIIVSALRDAVHKGLPRGYAEEAIWAGELTGRLDLSRLSDVFLWPGRVPCIADVYGLDVPANRLLRWAVTRLSSSVLSAPLARELTSFIPTFGEFASARPSLVEADRIRLPLQHEHLNEAVSVARLLLRAESLDHRFGSESAPSFLWKSASVFEAFVGHVLASVAEQAGWQFERSTYLLGTLDPLTRGVSRRLETTPDFVIHRTGGSLVLDAKYKGWGRSRSPKNSDVYQVLAGGRVLRASYAALIYPQVGASPRPPARWRLTGQGDPAWVCCAFINILAMAKEGGEEELVIALHRDLELLSN